MGCWCGSSASDVREGVIGQRFGHAAFDQIGGRVHLGGAQIFNDRSRFAVGRVTALLGMLLNELQRQRQEFQHV